MKKAMTYVCAAMLMVFPAWAQDVKTPEDCMQKMVTQININLTGSGATAKAAYEAIEKEREAIEKTAAALKPAAFDKKNQTYTIDMRPIRHGQGGGEFNANANMAYEIEPIEKALELLDAVKKANHTGRINSRAAPDMACIKQLRKQAM